MSEREVLSFRSIAAIDGGVIEVAFNQALNQILNDLRDRPGLDKKRSITLQVDLFPVCEHGHLARTDIEFQVKTSAPARKTISYPFKADRRGLTSCSCSSISRPGSTAGC